MDSWPYQHLLARLDDVMTLHHLRVGSVLQLHVVARQLLHLPLALLSCNTGHFSKGLSHETDLAFDDMYG